MYFKRYDEVWDKTLNVKNLKLQISLFWNFFCVLRAKEESEVVEKLQNNEPTQPTVQQTLTLALRRLLSSYLLEQNICSQNSSTVSVTGGWVELHHFLKPPNNTERQLLMLRTNLQLVSDQFSLRKLNSETSKFWHLRFLSQTLWYVFKWMASYAQADLGSSTQ